MESNCEGENALARNFTNTVTTLYHANNSSVFKSSESSVQITSALNNTPCSITPSQNFCELDIVSRREKEKADDQLTLRAIAENIRNAGIFRKKLYDTPPQERQSGVLYLANLVKDVDEDYCKPIISKSKDKAERTGTAISDFEKVNLKQKALDDFLRGQFRQHLPQKEQFLRFEERQAYFTETHIPKKNRYESKKKTHKDKQSTSKSVESKPIKQSHNAEKTEANAIPQVTLNEVSINDTNDEPDRIERKSVKYADLAEARAMYYVDLPNQNPFQIKQKKAKDKRKRDSKKHPKVFEQEDPKLGHIIINKIDSDEYPTVTSFGTDLSNIPVKLKSDQSFDSFAVFDRRINANTIHYNSPTSDRCEHNEGSEKPPKKDTQKSKQKKKHRPSPRGSFVDQDNCDFIPCKEEKRSAKKEVEVLYKKKAQRKVSVSKLSRSTPKQSNHKQKSDEKEKVRDNKSGKAMLSVKEKINELLSYGDKSKQKSSHKDKSSKKKNEEISKNLKAKETSEEPHPHHHHHHRKPSPRFEKSEELEHQKIPEPIKHLLRNPLEVHTLTLPRKDNDETTEKSVKYDNVELSFQEIQSLQIKEAKVENPHTDDAVASIYITDGVLKVDDPENHKRSYLNSKDLSYSPRRKKLLRKQKHRTHKEVPKNNSVPQLRLKKSKQKMQSQAKKEFHGEKNCQVSYLPPETKSQCVGVGTSAHQYMGYFVPPHVAEKFSRHYSPHSKPPLVENFRKISKDKRSRSCVDGKESGHTFKEFDSFLLPKVLDSGRSSDSRINLKIPRKKRSRSVVTKTEQTDFDRRTLDSIESQEHLRKEIKKLDDLTRSKVAPKTIEISTKSERSLEQDCAEMESDKKLTGTQRFKSRIQSKIDQEAILSLPIFHNGFNSSSNSLSSSDISSIIKVNVLLSQRPNTHYSLSIEDEILDANKKKNFRKQINSALNLKSVSDISPTHEILEQRKALEQKDSFSFKSESTSDAERRDSEKRLVVVHLVLGEKIFEICNKSIDHDGTILEGYVVSGLEPPKILGYSPKKSKLLRTVSKLHMMFFPPSQIVNLELTPKEAYVYGKFIQPEAVKENSEQIEDVHLVEHDVGSPAQYKIRKKKSPFENSKKSLKKNFNERFLNKSTESSSETLDIKSSLILHVSTSDVDNSKENVSYIVKEPTKPKAIQTPARPEIRSLSRINSAVKLMESSLQIIKEESQSTDSSARAANSCNQNDKNQKVSITDMKQTQTEFPKNDIEKMKEVINFLYMAIDSQNQSSISVTKSQMKHDSSSTESSSCCEQFKNMVRNVKPRFGTLKRLSKHDLTKCPSNVPRSSNITLETCFFSPKQNESTVSVNRMVCVSDKKLNTSANSKDSLQAISEHDKEDKAVGTEAKPEIKSSTSISDFSSVVISLNEQENCLLDNKNVDVQKNFDEPPNFQEEKSIQCVLMEVTSKGKEISQPSDSASSPAHNSFCLTVDDLSINKMIGSDHQKPSNKFLMPINEFQRPSNEVQRPTNAVQGLMNDFKVSMNEIKVSKKVLKGKTKQIKPEAQPAVNETMIFENKAFDLSPTTLSFENPVNPHYTALYANTQNESMFTKLVKKVSSHTFASPRDNRHTCHCISSESLREKRETTKKLRKRQSPPETDNGISCEKKAVQFDYSHLMKLEKHLEQVIGLYPTVCKAIKAHVTRNGKNKGHGRLDKTTNLLETVTSQETLATTVDTITEYNFIDSEENMAKRVHGRGKAKYVGMKFPLNRYLNENRFKLQKAMQVTRKHENKIQYLFNGLNHMDVLDSTPYPFTETTSSSSKSENYLKLKKRRKSRRPSHTKCSGKKKKKLNSHDFIESIFSDDARDNWSMGTPLHSISTPSLTKSDVLMPKSKSKSLTTTHVASAQISTSKSLLEVSSNKNMNTKAILQTFKDDLLKGRSSRTFRLGSQQVFVLSLDSTKPLTTSPSKLLAKVEHHLQQESDSNEVKLEASETKTKIDEHNCYSLLFSEKSQSKSLKRDNNTENHRPFYIHEDKHALNNQGNKDKDSSSSLDLWDSLEQKPKRHKSEEDLGNFSADSLDSSESKCDPCNTLALTQNKVLPNQNFFVYTSTVKYGINAKEEEDSSKPNNKPNRQTTNIRLGKHNDGKQTFAKVKSEKREASVGTSTFGASNKNGEDSSNTLISESGYETSNKTKPTVSIKNFFKKGSSLLDIFRHTAKNKNEKLYSEEKGNAPNEKQSGTTLTNFSKIWFKTRELNEDQLDINIPFARDDESCSTNKVCWSVGAQSDASKEDESGTKITFNSLALRVETPKSKTTGTCTTANKKCSVSRSLKSYEKQKVECHEYAEKVLQESLLRKDGSTKNFKDFKEIPLELLIGRPLLPSKTLKPSRSPTRTEKGTNVSSLTDNFSKYPYYDSDYIQPYITIADDKIVFSSSPVPPKTKVWREKQTRVSATSPRYSPTRAQPKRCSLPGSLHDLCCKPRAASKGVQRDDLDSDLDDLPPKPRSKKLQVDIDDGKRTPYKKKFPMLDKGTAYEHKFTRPKKVSSSKECGCSAASIDKVSARTEEEVPKMVSKSIDTAEELPKRVVIIPQAMEEPEKPPSRQPSKQLHSALKLTLPSPKLEPIPKLKIKLPDDENLELLQETTPLEVLHFQPDLNPDEDDIEVGLLPVDSLLDRASTITIDNFDISTTHSCASFVEKIMDEVISLAIDERVIRIENAENVEDEEEQKVTEEGGKDEEEEEEGKEEDGKGGVKEEAEEEMHEEIVEDKESTEEEMQDLSSEEARRKTSDDFRKGLTDKEVFDKLLTSFEKEDEIAVRLSKDETFFQNQIMNLKKESEESLDEVPDKQEQEARLSDEALGGKHRSTHFWEEKMKALRARDDNPVKTDDIGTCFSRGFRPDNIALSGDACFNLNKQDNLKFTKGMLTDEESVIDFSERETPLDYLLALGFMVDEASNALKDDDIRSRLLAAITEARVWINKITTTQGTLLYLVAYKSRPKTMRYFLQLVEAIINKRINNAIKLDGFLRVLEKVEEGEVQMINILGADKFEDEENEEKIVKKQLRQLFITVYKIAEKEAQQKDKQLTQQAVVLLRILAAKYRAGLHPHLELIARYIGQELLNTETQLEAAMIFLSRLDTAEVKLKEFEAYCDIKCDKKKQKHALVHPVDDTKSEKSSKNGRKSESRSDDIDIAK